MKTFYEIEKFVTDNAMFGVEYVGIVGYSTGIRIAMVDNREFFYEVRTALKRFEDGDFGTFYEDDEEPTPGREYGCYDSVLGGFPDGAIMIHRDFYRVTVYFQFER